MVPRFTDATVAAVVRRARGIVVPWAIAAYADLTAHVQIADCPGRGEPGTGSLDLDGLLGELAGRGYAGWVGLEYKPSTDTETSLAWLPLSRRSSST